MGELHLTRKQAEALGLNGGDKHPRAKQPRKRKPKRAYHTRCTTCGEEFTTEASEERHLASAHHARYENIFTVKGTP
ncbi:MAG TPA: hypothetical protein VLI04_13650 [Nocardioidaceae bacterium]|nr:hypothetical protein [Nocardioidaceae bacterium]